MCGACVRVCFLQRNQFLEAESVEMEKERNQIRWDVVAGLPDVFILFHHLQICCFLKVL